MEDAAPETRQDAGFRSWIDTTIRDRALSRMIRPRVFNEAMHNVRFLPDVIDLQARNRSARLAVWDYLDIAVSAERIKNGRQAIRRHRDLFVSIERSFGVEPEVIAAIWGLETGYGAARGGLPVLSTLATLAYKGQRPAFHEDELIAALRIVQSGHRMAEDLRGTWSGAMGHGNILPSALLDFGQDVAGKGHVDVWGKDPADSLATIAHYLAKHGWRRGQPWGYELRLPDDFDFATTGTEQAFPSGTWDACGLRTAEGARIPDYGSGSVILPAGAEGVPLMVLRNFHILLRYGRRLPFAIAIGHLADRLGGAKGFVAGWPQDASAPSPDDLHEARIHLNALGFTTLEVTGTLGPGTARAVRDYQSSRGLVPDGYVSDSLLARLRDERSQGQA
ncbi:lytic murein transglycosylase [uncultured Maritimibacter sp.]|jgi:membrane-bound lytic murein transglycosylase B|uniref:lytic murein transglycosylase n=1 Tax=uncultured Maritimibacter sp. TaxID=991866 RepID=UPI000AD3CF87|nr:lytic murein transglycosylase [uncultured Maritimibacter sp.]